MDSPEAPHVPHRPEHRPSRSWFDIAFSVSVVMISLVSLATAIHHGKVMEELVHTNARQASASVWPSIETAFATNSAGQASIFSVGVRNSGVGPARIHSFRVFVDNGPVANLEEFARACCGGDTSGVWLQTSSNVAGRLLPAGEDVTAFRIGVDPQQGLSRFDAVRNTWLSDRVRSEICYCSVFDECWTATNWESVGEPVAACPADAESFQAL